MKHKNARMTSSVSAVMVAAFFGTSPAQNNPNDVADHAKRPRNAVAIAPETTQTLKALNERLAEIAKLWEAKGIEAARSEYRKILATTNAPSHYRSYAHLRIAQSYAAEENLAAARAEYENIKAASEYPPVHRYEAEEILKEMDRVAKGLRARDVMASRWRVTTSASTTRMIPATRR
jgi:transcription initiation factor TFIIIB Brf1 subunit/transcription initiation factor TFIIB